MHDLTFMGKITGIMHKGALRAIKVCVHLSVIPWTLSPLVVKTVESKWNHILESEARCELEGR